MRSLGHETDGISDAFELTGLASGGNLCTGFFGEATCPDALQFVAGATDVEYKYVLIGFREARQRTNRWPDITYQVRVSSMATVGCPLLPSSANSGSILTSCWASSEVRIVPVLQQLFQYETLKLLQSLCNRTLRV